MFLPQCHHCWAFRGFVPFLTRVSDGAMYIVFSFAFSGENTLQSGILESKGF